MVKEMLQPNVQLTDTGFGLTDGLQLKEERRLKA
jgi:hypothetical protein